MNRPSLAQRILDILNESALPVPTPALIVMVAYRKKNARSLVWDALRILERRQFAVRSKGYRVTLWSRGPNPSQTTSRKCVCEVAAELLREMGRTQFGSADFYILRRIADRARLRSQPQRRISSVLQALSNKPGPLKKIHVKSGNRTYRFFQLA